MKSLVRLHRRFLAALTFCDSTKKTPKVEHGFPLVLLKLHIDLGSQTTPCPIVSLPLQWVSPNDDVNRDQGKTWSDVTMMGENAPHDWPPPASLPMVPSCPSHTTLAPSASSAGHLMLPFQVPLRWIRQEASSWLLGSAELLCCTSCVPLP